MTAAPDPFRAPPDEPLALLGSWVAAARAAGVREPLAVTLATAGSDGRVTGRTVVLRAVDADGVLLTGMRTGTKGRQLRENPWAAVTGYWREVGRQVTLDGPVHEVDGPPADTLFAAMPRVAQAATAVSRPGEPWTDEVVLDGRTAALVADGRPIPRPVDWVGYRLVPARVELWQSSPTDRLHRRLRYERTATGWTATRLQP